MFLRFGTPLAPASGMLYGMYLSASGALVEEVRQAVIANNIANVSTGGYKLETAVFRKRLTEAEEDLVPGEPLDPVLEGLSGGIFLDEVTFARKPGPFIASGGPLDLALRGDGFFAVTDGQSTFYTRAGNFQRNGTGELVTADGRHHVLGIDGKPIQLGTGEVKVSAQGKIWVNGAYRGQLLLQGSLDPSQFEKVGETLYRFLGSSTPPAAKADVMQGYQETSDVSPVGEMVKLIQSHRAYEANMQMARIQDTSLERAVTELPRVLG